MSQAEPATRAPASTAAIGWADDGMLEVLTFDLGGQTVAVEAAIVREIVDLLPETTVPGAPAMVASVCNFRGRVVPLADLRLAFGMEPGVATADSRIVVIEIEHAGEPLLVGLKTDRVHEVASFAEAMAEEPPAIGLRWRREHLRGLVRHQGDIVILPDLGAIFATILS